MLVKTRILLSSLIGKIADRRGLLLSTLEAYGRRSLILMMLLIPPTWYKQINQVWVPQNDLNSDCRIDLFDFYLAQSWPRTICSHQAIRIVWYMEGPVINLCLSSCSY